MLKILSFNNNINIYKDKSQNISNKRQNIPTFASDTFKNSKKRKYVVGDNFNFRSGFAPLNSNYSDNELKEFNSNRVLPGNLFLVSFYKNNEKHKNNNGFIVQNLSSKNVKKLRKKGKIVTKTLPEEVSLVNYNGKTYVKDNNLVDLKKAKRKELAMKVLTIIAAIAIPLIATKLLYGKKGENGATIDDDPFDVFDFLLCADFFM